MNTSSGRCEPRHFAESRAPGWQGPLALPSPHTRGGLRAHWIRQPGHAALIQRWLVQSPAYAALRPQPLTAA